MPSHYMAIRPSRPVDVFTRNPLSKQDVNEHHLPGTVGTAAQAFRTRKRDPRPGTMSQTLPNTTRRKRRPITTKLHAVLAVLALTAGLGLVVPGTASAAPFCGIAWGSLAKSAATLALGPSQDPITNIRSGRHACFDRLVVDATARSPDTPCAMSGP